MYKIILSLIMLLNTISYSQTISDVVITDTSLTKTNLYSNALAFFALEFKSANDVIQMKDTETGKVIGKGIVDNREVVISISCKNGKYKYDIDITPFKNVIPTDIDIDVNKFGMYNGKTKGTIVWSNGKSNISNIRFIYNNGTWIVNYDGSGKPLGMNNAYEKWLVSVDNELVILNKKYADMNNPNEERNQIIINNLIVDLKREMNKKSDW